MRAHLNKAVIRKVSGTPADGSCQVYEPGTTTPLAQTIYAADTGGTTKANPFTFTGGVVEFYVDAPQRVKLVITPTGGSAQTFDNVEVPLIAFGNPTAQITYGAASANGTAPTGPRSDHLHGTPPLTAVTPAASAVGDAAAVGTGTAPAKEDHKHAREAFGAVTAQTTAGAASSNGVATTDARSDHTHGTPAVPAQGVVLHSISSQTGNYSVAAGISVVFASGASQTITLPAAASNSGRQIIVKDTGTSAVTVATAGGNIEGASTATLNPNGSITCVSNGTDWFVV